MQAGKKRTAIEAEIDPGPRSLLSTAKTQLHYRSRILSAVQFALYTGGKVWNPREAQGISSRMRNHFRHGNHGNHRGYPWHSLTHLQHP